MQASSSGYRRLNSMTEYEDSEDLALVGFLRSTFGMNEVYHNFSGKGIVTSPELSWCQTPATHRLMAAISYEAGRIHSAT